VCGGFHSATNGCNVAVNLKRVADEAAPVLKGIGEVLTAASKIQCELAKGKDCGEVFGKLTNFVQTGGEILKCLNGTLDYSKQRLKTSTMNQPRMQERGDSCPFSHPDAFKGTKKGPGGAGEQPAKTTGPAGTAPAVPTAVPTTEVDGPVANTLCK
jgi:hypothetical protein